MAEVGYGIIGCGVIAPIHAEGIRMSPGARLVAVADVNMEQARALANKHGAEAYEDYRWMIQRNDVDAVCLCVPSGLRCEIGVECAKAGKHVLSEKPLEVTSERIDALVSAIDTEGVKLGCIFQYRFSPGAKHIRDAVDHGRFGNMVLGDAYIKWYRSQEYYESGAWRGTRRLDGGGALMNQGIHQIDLLLHFMGKVTEVQARTALRGHKDLEVEDLACALLTFENGALGVIEGSTAAWPGQPARVEVHGSQGVAALEDGKLAEWRFMEETPEDEQLRASLGGASVTGSGAADPTSNLSSEGHRLQIADFTNAIIEDRRPAIDGREGRRAVRLIEAIYESAARGGETVSL